MKLILHSYRRCPFCIRTRILLSLKKIPYEIVEEPLRVWTPWMKEWSSGTGERPRVPVLRIVDDGGEERIMPESNDINLFLDTEFGTREYTPEAGSPAYTEMFTWFDWCAKELKPTLDLYKYGENKIFDKEKHPEHTKQLHTLVQVLEEALTKNGPLQGDTFTKDRSLQGEYLLEGRLTLADIAIIPFMRQIMRTREGEFDFTPYLKVLAWTNTIIDTDWFRDEVM